MTRTTNILLEKYQIRKSRTQKEAFRIWLTDILKREGYSAQVESGGSIVKSDNVIVGDPEHAHVIFTAHYDTCAALLFPNFITPHNFLLYLLYQILIVIPMFAVAIGAEILLLAAWDNCPIWLAMLVVYAVLIFSVWWIMDGPSNKHTSNDNTSGVITLIEIALALPKEDRNAVAFIFFDNEEKGLLGSSLYKKMHGNIARNTLVINYDCVSDGDHIHLFPSKKVKQDHQTMALLEKHFTSADNKTVKVVRGFGFYPSDQKAFLWGIGVAALHKSRVGYWLGRIHTKHDTVLDKENILLLKEQSLSLISEFREKKD